MGKLSLLPSVFLPLHVSMILAAACALPMVVRWDPAGRLKQPGTRAGCRLALGPMYYPVGKSLEGRRSQDSPYVPALSTENTFFLLIVAHAEKTPKSPLQRKPLGVPAVG